MRTKTCDGVTRRNILRLGVVGGLGLALANFGSRSRAEKSRGPSQSCIFLHLAGGPAHLDTLDMKPDAPSEERGEFGMIQTVIPGLTACEHLPKLAAALDRFTLIRGISHSAGAHPQANQYLFSGNRSTPALTHPALGSILLKERPVADELPGFVAVPNSDMTPGYMGIAYGPLSTTATPKKGEPFQVRGLALEEGIPLEKIRRRNELLADLDATFRRQDVDSDLLTAIDGFGQKAEKMILSPRSREAFDISRESSAITGLFGDDDLGQSLLLAARLVEHGVRFVTINHNGWDTHLDNFARLKGELLPPLDAGLTALVEALRAKGLLDSTLVVATGEFGRTPKINQNGGRDHWPRAMWTLMAGGGVVPGQLIGGTDSAGHGPDDSTHLTPDDLAASILHALGVDPRTEYYTSTGRPVLLVAEGKVISGLLGA